MDSHFSDVCSSTDNNQNNQIFWLHGIQPKILYTGGMYNVITYLSVPIGPLSSMVSPITLIILPNVSGPTGIVIGPPVSVHFWPLTRPSVPSIAMVRTVFSPNEIYDQTRL